MRLIELLRQFNLTPTNGNQMTFEEAIQQLSDYLQREGAEIVVRCQDCWNATKIGGFMGEVLYCPIWGRNTDDECFCSYGERRVE